jgi:hypothetical protein
VSYECVLGTTGNLGVIQIGALLADLVYEPAPQASLREDGLLVAALLRPARVGRDLGPS